MRTRSAPETSIAALAAAGWLAVAVAVAPAQAVVTEPIPANPPSGPPPIPSLPVAGDTAPPADVIGDPIEPAANCSGWYQQTYYGGIWSAGSTWWEYECSYEEVIYPSCYFGSGMTCMGYTIVAGPWTDRFYWDGSQPVFLGENHSSGCDYWWDAPTSQWFLFVTPSCPSEPGPASPPPPPNATPTASFEIRCAGLHCDLDGSGSVDSDGTIVQYEWALGDGTTAAGQTVKYSYTQDGRYTVTLTVTDDDGGSGTATKVLAPIAGLTARGYRVKGLQKVDLSWSGSGADGFVIYRDGQTIATAAGSSYTDNLNRKGSGSYAYKVCQTGTSICTTQATVSF